MLNITIVAQAGRIGYQALLCVASIRMFHSAKDVRIFVCIPRHSPTWTSDPTPTDPDLMEGFGKYDCEIVSFENAAFGSVYPHSNKMYAIIAAPPGEPFLFCDSDTVLVTTIGETSLDMARPALKPAGDNWPDPTKGLKSIGQTWRGLYEYFGVNAAPYFDAARGDDKFQCYPYYNAGIVYYAEPQNFGRLWLDMAKAIWRERPPAIRGQQLKPWQDQIALPMVLASLGVPRSAEPDPIHHQFIHYHFPFYLQVRHKQATQILAEVSKDAQLVSTLMHDEAFGYFLSEEGKRTVAETHSEMMKAGRTDYRAFVAMLKDRVPRLR